MGSSKTKQRRPPQYFYIVPTSCTILPTMHHILFTAIIIMCGILNYLTHLYADTDSALPTLDLQRLMLIANGSTRSWMMFFGESWIPGFFPWIYFSLSHQKHHLRSFHKPYLPCSASLAFSTKPTLSMHINMPYIPTTAHFTAARAFNKPYLQCSAAITKPHSLWTSTCIRSTPSTVHSKAAIKL